MPLNEEQIKRALKDAQVLDAAAQRKPQPVETRLLDCDIDAGDQVYPDGQIVKRLVIKHRSGAQSWVVELPIAGAQAVGKFLQQPPRLTNGNGAGE